MKPGIGKKLFRLTAFPLFIIGVFVVLWIFRKPIWGIVSNPEQVRAWVEAQGVAAPFIFVILQVVQVVVFVIPGEVPQIAGGYIFGVFWGSIYSITGIAVGSLIGFILSRMLGRPFVYSLLKEEGINKFEALTSAKRNRIAFFLLFVIPGIPKDSLCYIAGITQLKILPFLLISMAGRLPGIIGSAFIGAAISKKHWLIAGNIIGIAVVLFIIGYLFREKIRRFIMRIAKKEKHP